jgi:hypothetical protein
VKVKATQMILENRFSSRPSKLIEELFVISILSFIC